jgi:acetoin utilization protein AcuB
VRDPITDIRRIAHMSCSNTRSMAYRSSTKPEALVGFVSRSDILRAIIADPPLSLWR